MYKINSCYIDSDKKTLWVDVTFTLNDGTTLDIQIPSFIPQDKDAVLQNIVNRQQTEQSMYDALANNEAIKSAIDLLI